MSDTPVVLGNIHHEILVYDAYEAAKFFEDILGATRVEIEFANMVEQGWDVKNRHMYLGGPMGGRVYQLLEPQHDIPNTPSRLRNWYDRKVTPGIHNITYAVSDAEALAYKMRDWGVASMGEMVSPDGGKVYMYDATKQCGIRFEFVQAPPDGPAYQTDPDPATLPPSKFVTGNIHLEMLVNDPAMAVEFMEDVFGAKRTEYEFARFIEEHFELRNRHVELAGQIYQFIRPNDTVVSPKLMNWYDTDVRPGIHNVTLMVNDGPGFAKALREAGCRCMGEMKPFDGDDVPATVYMYDATKQCGLRFEFAEVPTEAPA
jgi:catechol 2,3-dioxygenase-like lactoylglutathione lyase family enzyme